MPQTLRSRAMPGRISRALLLLVVGAMLAAGLAGAAYADNYLNRGISWGATQPVLYTDTNPLGVNTSLQTEVEPTKIKRTLDAVRDGGFKFIRQTFAWNDIEIEGKGDFTDRRNPGKVQDAWKKYDYIVDSARLRELEVIARLDSTPDWARDPTQQDTQQFLKGPPTRYEDYGDFVFKAVSHFKGRVRYFQLWNEPNLQGEWGGLKINAADFTRLLKIAYTRAKEANPEAVILMPGLAPTDGLDYPINMNDMAFLQAMYDAGAKDYFDIASVMIYGFDDPADTRRLEYKRINFARPILTREVMVRNGDAAKPVWASEYAWLALDPTLDSQNVWPPNPKYNGKKTMWLNGVTEEQQGRYLVEGYERAKKEWPWMGVMCVWKLRDPDANPQEPATWFSLLRPDFTPRPAYVALQTYARNGGDGTIAGVGYHAARDPAVDYGDGWRREPNGDMIGDPGAQLTINTLLDTDFKLDSRAANGDRAGGTVAIQKINNRQIVTVTSQNMRLRGFSLSRPQPMLAAVGFPLAYTVGVAGLAAVSYRLLPWLLWLLDSLWLLVSGRRRPTQQPARQPSASGTTSEAQATRGTTSEARPARGATRRPNLLRQIGYTLLHMALPPKTIHPLATSRYRQGLPGVVQRLNEPERWWVVALGLVASIALFYLPNTRAHFVADINPWGLILGGLGILLFSLPQPHLLLAAIVALVPLYNNGNVATYTKFIGRANFPIAELLLAAAVLVVLIRLLALGWFDRYAPASWQFADRGATTVIPAIRTPRSRLLQYLRSDTFALLTIAWLIVGVLGVIFVANPAFRADSLREFRWTILEPLIFYYLYLYAVREHKAMLRVFDALVAAAVLVALYGFYQLIFDVRVVEAAGLSRMVSVYLHPNNLALYLGRVFPLALALAMFLPAGQGRRLAYGLACVPILAAILFSFSRGGWLGVAGATVVVAFLGWRYVWQGLKISRQWLIGGGVAVVATVIGGVIVALPRINDLGSLGLRVYLWEGAVKMIRDRPIFGVGLDQFYNQYRDVYLDRSNAAALAEQFTDHPHNFLLDYWLRLGIIGLLVAGLLLLSYLRTGRWLLRLTKNSTSQAMLIGLLALLADFVLHGLLDRAYFLPDLALLFWLACAALEANRRLVLDER